MSLLAPLYVAGLLAISLPILFHFIRRTPRGQHAFSSLMFLSPSPPRVTRRSRLEHILLLLLRGLALALLALAFARPYFRDAASQQLADQPGRRIAILLDASASMRRGDVWPQALAACEEELRHVTPREQLALLSFADRVETWIGFDAWQKLDPAQRAELARSELKNLTAAWGATQLGDALATTADLLADSGDPTSADQPRQIVLVSDLQQGSRLEALQSFTWPAGVTLRVRNVAPKNGSNAGLSLAAAVEESAAADNRLRVRVNNQPDSRHERFTLRWANAAGPLSSVQPIEVSAPAGQSRVVQIKQPPKSSPADRLVLSGDDFDFDNTLFVVPPEPEQATVAYFGRDAADDTQGLFYYIDRAFSQSPRRQVRVVAVSPAGPIEPGLFDNLRLAIASEPSPATQLAELKKYVADGGTLLVVLAKSDAAALQPWADFGLPKLAVEEALGGDYALLADMTYSHPLFAPFADPRFGDFTKIHFWKHRRVQLPAETKIHVLARFDNGDPAFFEQPSGRGSLIVMASSWRPIDSQLAMSSKFVPLVSALVDRGGPDNLPTQFTVGDKVPSGSKQPAVALRPGIFEADGRRFAVNLAADESRTVPFAVEQLADRGVRLENSASLKADVERRRQLQIAELENRQKMWRWCIVAVLALVIAETAVAGHLTRRPTAEAAPAERETRG